MTPLIVYCVLILSVSLAGGWVPLMIRLTHARMEMAVSLVAGFMLGVGVLHMLPHGLHAVASVNTVMLCLLFGFLVMFFIERFFCFHHHDVPADDGSDRTNHGGHGHDHTLSWTGAAIGLTLHSLIAGIALAASMRSESAQGDPGGPAGLAVFLVILLHKPFDSLTIGTLMAVGGETPTRRHLVNGLFALAVPVGAVLFHVGVDVAAGAPHYVTGCALAFSAGTFLCISTSDLLPELQFHTHDRVKLSVMLLLGLVLAWTVARIEQGQHRQEDGLERTVPSQVHEH